MFRAFLKLELTSLGGPIARLGYFRDELVVRRRWIDEAGYADLAGIKANIVFESWTPHTLLAMAERRVPQTDWDWLSVAQHQGLPTRLLDWTANALAGLWFAVSDDLAHGTDHAVLWVLTVQEENLKSPSPRQDIFALRRTYVFQPYHIDRRMAAQSGWFSVHRYSEGSGRFVPLDRNSQYKESLEKYLIPRPTIPSIRRELRLMGVTHATMFPDLSGLCASIQAEFLEELPDVDRI